MTYEELKKIANEMGYNLVKKKPYVKALPCICGAKRREEWYIIDGGRIFYTCSECGLKSPSGKNRREANILWNEMIRDEMEMIGNNEPDEKGDD